VQQRSEATAELLEFVSKEKAVVEVQNELAQCEEAKPRRRPSSDLL
jgi:hypothetical protein